VIHIIPAGLSGGSVQEPLSVAGQDGETGPPSQQKGMTMVPGQVLIVVAIAGLFVGGVVILLRKKKLALPPLRIPRAKGPEVPPQGKADLMGLAQGVASTYPELGLRPAELLTEIEAYCKKARPSPDNTSRIILEKMLAAGSLQKAMSYWQVHGFLHYRDKLKKN
jgi:hypothetical protein